MQFRSIRIKHLGYHALTLLAILMVGTLIINTSPFDEELIPELQALLKRDPTVPVDGNAYTLILGYTTANDGDPLEVGKALISLYRKKYADGGALTISDEEYLQIHGASDLDRAWQSEYSALTCRARLEWNCIDELVKQLNNKPATDRRMGTMLQRYQQIVAQPTFLENDELDVSSRLPNYDVMVKLSRIALADSLRQGNIDGAIVALEKDMGFWRMVLRDGQSLIAKMVANAGLRMDIQAISYLIANSEFDDMQQQKLMNLVEPLSAEAVDISETFWWERKIGIRSGDFRQQSDNWLENLLVAIVYQPNATDNENYHVFWLPLLYLCKLSAPEFIEQVATKPMSYKFKIFPPSLYNLGGKYIIAQSFPTTVPDYIGRIHDLSGMFNLVDLQLEIKSAAGISVADVVRHSHYTNPYTGEPMQYDASQHLIGFTCFRSVEKCQLSL